MDDSIETSTFDKNVRIGDLYNYFDGNVVKIPSFEVQSKSIIIDQKITHETRSSFFYKQLDISKDFLLGINSHSRQQLKAKSATDLNQQLWFRNYIQTPTTNQGDTDKLAQVDVFLRVIQRTETLFPEFVDSQMFNYQLHSGSKATHLVEKISYGAEFICTIQKVLQQGSKEDVEDEIQSAANIYFEQILEPEKNYELPTELNGVKCTVYSSQSDEESTFSSFQDAIQSIRHTITLFRLEKDVHSISSPVQMKLRLIPKILEVQRYRERVMDYQQSSTRTMDSIQRQSNKLKKYSSIDNVPPLKKVLGNFLDLIEPLWEKIEDIYKEFMTSENAEKLEKQHNDISSLLREIGDWLKNLEKQSNMFSKLLKGIELKILYSKELESRAPSQEKNAKIFILEIEWISDELMEKIKSAVGRKHEESQSKIPEFSITDESLTDVIKKLCEFNREANDRNDPSIGYYIGLVSASSTKIPDGIIKTITYQPEIIQENTFFDQPSKQRLSIESDKKTTIKTEEEIENDEMDIDQSVTGSFGNENRMSSQLKSTVLPFTDCYYDRSQAYNTGLIICGNLTPITTFKESDTPVVLSSFTPSLQQLGSGKKSKDSEELDDMLNLETNLKIGSYSEDQDMSSISSQSSSTNDLKDYQELSTVRPAEVNERTEFMNTTKGSENKKVDQRRTTELNTRKNSDPLDKFNKRKNTVSDEKTLDSQQDLNVTSTGIFEGGNPTKPAATAITIDKNIFSKDLKDGNEERNTSSSYGTRYQQRQGHKRLGHQRIAEVFVKDKNVSKLIQKDVPNVYLLNVEESSINTELRSFHVVNSEIKSSLRHQNHKVIILMGATGSGKSTLINGMVNYILGVQWKDPFRFKVVREDESAASRNQAHSQTSSVTAYTLEHQDGMTVPYSITIIDTPGYGDTRGIKRDKEITRAIHQFLSLTDTEFNEIHAVCFVSASGDSRLTATQRYILDSVLSTFGKDVKDNIRLLVTFADSATPPVIEACKEAHFPMTSKSAEIIYSKFNSSVLYACNELEDDFSFDELFWDMGQENFQKFFKMLEAMKGRDLTSTREVIGRRQQAEWALKNIEKEVDVCLVKIENIEKFQSQIRAHGNNMEANKNHTFEVTELRPRLVGYKNKLKVAYNCHKCKKTCEPPGVIKNLDMVFDDLSIITKTKCNCCPYCSVNDHEYERSVYRQEEVKVTRTFHDMKAQFESNYKKKLSTQDLLNKCSEDLEYAKVKVLSLLSQLEENARSLDSTALFLTALSPADYLSLMRSRIAEEQKPGYMNRLETLSELQRCLAAQAATRATSVPVARSSRMFSGSLNSAFL